ncbi:hypothetical protein ABZX40_31910 [Streptomyces sp. NPDC004610]|uniref:hypothetical protein n=1 Tax=unclassified Streptomyces TaxID=2593676 RepID=UPI0033AD203B
MSERRLNQLWGAVCALLGAFLLLWLLSWINAGVLHEDLQNSCADLRTGSFPFEKSCAHADGRVEGANGPLFESAFYVSLIAGLACLGWAFLIEAARRRK